MIFDEVISYRVAAGGAQARYGVMPDLTAFGKIIGGGLPVGAFGGRADIMAQYDPPTKLSHAGTFNGNPITMAAGLAAMMMLTPAAFERLADLGQLLQTRLVEVTHDFGDTFAVNTIASLVSLTMPETASVDQATATEIMRLLHLALLNRGIKGAAIFSISTVMTEAEIERLVTTLRDVLSLFRPVIEA